MSISSTMVAISIPYNVAIHNKNTSMYMQIFKLPIFLATTCDHSFNITHIAQLFSKKFDSLQVDVKKSTKKQFGLLGDEQS